MLVYEIGRFDEVFIVIDALDERLAKGCAEALLEALLKTKANVLVTSRDIEIIRKNLKEADSIEIKARQEDVTEYITWKLSQPEARVLREELETEDGLHSTVISTIVSHMGDT